MSDPIVIPANPHLPAVAFGLGFDLRRGKDDPPERPTIDHVMSARCLVVGWRVFPGAEKCFDQAEPVFYEQLGRDHIVFIEVAPGMFHVSPYGDTGQDHGHHRRRERHGRDRAGGSLTRSPRRRWRGAMARR
jgi:hypothetical protein